ncbi:BRCA1 associated RING domain 1 [Desmophyllum pertusum]|uniref:BRCA1 associated RING domain 1 n=1 Tax=Desmophyllum pertusum TaxID=174260 RepID=A0A9W9ZTE8_9CNID|nr:BRCA1 associated RING domain 1 [Desmophyllum pertusum]
MNRIVNRWYNPQISGQKKGILKEGVSNKGNLSASPLSRSGSYLGTLEKSVDFHCSFETDGSSEQDIDIPCTQPVSHDKILEGVVAFIEVRSNTENRFEGISKQMEMLGAMVVKKLTPEVTHVIFKDGKKTTRERALKKGVHVVSVLWVESCRQSGKRVSEDLFPVVAPEQAVTPLIVGRLKRTKSMQPKAFEEDVQNSADRGDKRRKRKLQAENLTPAAMVFCAETQDPYSPVTVNPPLTPHMVPDTPCHVLEISPPFTKTLSYGKVGTMYICICVQATD